MKLTRLLYRLAPPATGVAVVLAGWHTSRVYVASGIAERAELQPATSRAAISELAQLGDSALPALIDAAVCDDREVAIPARQAIEAKISRWAAGEPMSVERRCLGIVQEVLKHEPQLTPSGRVWARQLGEQVLRTLANAQVATTDLTTVEAVESLFKAVSQTSQYLDQPLRPRNAQPVAIPAPGLAGVGVLGPITSNPPIEPGPPPPPPVEVVELTPRSASGVVAPLNESGMPDSILPEFDKPALEAQLIPETTAAGPPSMGSDNLPWRTPEAASPILAEDTPSGSDTADSQAVPLAEQKLPAEVEQLMQGSEADRLRLVEQLLAAKYDNAAAVLLRLAKDPSPKVRVSALSAMGSSPNRRLTAAAYDLAIHDEDPKVASLANELQKLLQ